MIFRPGRVRKFIKWLNAFNEQISVALSIFIIFYRVDIVSNGLVGYSCG